MSGDVHQWPLPRWHGRKRCVTKHTPVHVAHEVPLYTKHRCVGAQVQCVGHGHTALDFAEAEMHVRP